MREESNQNNNPYNINYLNNDGLSNENQSSNNGFFMGNQINANSGIFNGSQINSNMLNQNPYYFGEMPNNYSSNFSNESSNQNNPIFKFDSIDNKNTQDNVMPGFENANNTNSSNTQGNVMPGFENVNNANTQGNVMPGFENVNNANTQGNVMPVFESSNNANEQDNVMPGFENVNSANTQENVMPGFENEDYTNTQESTTPEVEKQPLPEMQNFSKEKIQNNGQSVYVDQGVDSSYDGGDQSYNNEQYSNLLNQQQYQNQTANGNYINENQYQNTQNNNLNSNDQYQNTQYNSLNSNDPYQTQYNNTNTGDPYQQQYNNTNTNDPYQSQYNMNSNQNMQYNNNYAQQNMDQNFQYQDMNANAQYQNMNQGNMNNSGASGDYNLQFVKSWMGSIYEKAHSKKFNICAALFNGIYLYYRKMYTLGTILLALQLIISTAIVMLIPNNIGIIVGIIYYVVLFLGMGFGFYPLYRSFVKGKLDQYKSQTTDNNQLIALANQKGGTSIGALVIYIIISLVFSGAVSAMTRNQFDKTSSKNETNNVSNTEDEQIAQMSQYIIDNEYEIEYNSLKWVYDSTSDSLINGAYTLKYTAKYQDTTLGADFSSDTQRAAVLEKLVTSFTNQAASQNMQVESPNSTFIAKNSEYYAYVDVIGTGDISRYYFVIFPSEKLLFQFVLTINDTAIDSAVNIDVIDIITQIKKITASTTTGNNIDENTIAGNITTDNTVLANDTNETNSTSSSRTILSSNVTDTANTTETTNTTNTTNTTGTTVASNILQSNE